jgi:lipopolysaccharide/colanic/teichoic acid biosynthesis glycosyltransferase
MRSRTVRSALFDIISVAIVFSLFLLLKPEPFLRAVDRYLNSLLIFLGVWLVVSFMSNKYSIHKLQELPQILRLIIISNILIMGVSTTLMYLFRVDYFSRIVVFGTIAVSTLIELVYGSIRYYIRMALLEPVEAEEKKVTRRRQFLKGVLKPGKILFRKDRLSARESAILVEIDKEAYDFVFEQANIESPNTLIISTTSRFNIDTQLQDQFEAIVNLKRINDIRYVNKFFESANAKLPIGGLFICYVETKNLRKRRILNKYIFPVNYIVYIIDFIVKRLLPKFKLTKGLYFFLTRGQNRVLSKAETYGRLYSCGFEVINEKLVKNHLFFVARKISEPHYPEDPTYGPLVKLDRIGYKGKMIKVYKLRTMHPYAEYLQEYIYEKEGLDAGGKFKSDFRISTLGRFLRAFWLDELPMLANLFRGEIKLVGVRPLSKHYFSLYSKKLQKRRITYKPGLIPPYYIQKPETLEEIMESETRYMDEYDRHPFRTDVKYFFRAIYNIVFRWRRYRSS